MEKNTESKFSYVNILFVSYAKALATPQTVFKYNNKSSARNLHKNIVIKNNKRFIADINEEMSLRLSKRARIAGQDWEKQMLNVLI